MNEMVRSPFDKGFRVIGYRRGRRVLHMPEDRVEDRPFMARQIQHELTEFTVEVGEKEESLVAQHREAGVVHGADRILRFEQVGHHRGQTRLSSFSPTSTVNS